MTVEYIKLWNESVTPQETVFFLGDFAFAGTQKIEAILKHLNRKKLVLIKGNHDFGVSNKRWLELGVDEVHDQLIIEYRSQQILLCHFPYLAGAEGEDERYKELRPIDCGLPLIHGHIHSAPERKIRLTNKLTPMYDVGVDANYGRLSNIYNILHEISTYPRNIRNSSSID